MPHNGSEMWNMMTSSNGNIFSVAGHFNGEFTGHRWIPRTKASDAELWWVFFYLRLIKRLSKQSRGWWFETPSWSQRRLCNGITGQFPAHLPSTVENVTNSLLQHMCKWLAIVMHLMPLTRNVLIRRDMNLVTVYRYFTQCLLNVVTWKFGNPTNTTFMREWNYLKYSHVIYVDKFHNGFDLPYKVH